MKVTNFSENDRMMEVQYQFCMATSSKSFKTKQNSEMIFEDLVSQKIREIHLDGWKLELIGIAAGFTANDCPGKTLSHE